MISLSYVSNQIEMLTSEDDLIAEWEGSEILVSIVCTAYNHEEFISDALNGFINQQTSFPFEIIINDDCSSDKTLEIIMLYKEKYPNVINVISHHSNQFSKGISPFKFVYKKLRGKYIAICEGDDFWSDREKLSKQFDALENDIESNLCIHSAAGLKNGQLIENTNWCFEKDRYSLDDIFLNPGQFSPTSSYFFRKSLVEHHDELKSMLFKAGVGDFFVEIFAANKGKKIVALNEVMSTYRVQSSGSWSEANLKNLNVKFSNTYAFISDIQHVSDLFLPKYKSLFDKKIAEELQDCIILGIRNYEYQDVLIFAMKNIKKIKISLFIRRVIRKVFL
ncbi:glycosyltransferase involved in cell wall biosynthesis [Aeromonas sp. BIGb0405]|uniref:glycosyltransferase family 2 protein n=1 Tax=Aeromonas sp. BIGb0405 TaxID=2940592 RepID=UPI0021698D72|nr:glycosyltransferase [Aeromonas sp. BIGb0405]MCS3455403.1 glycosyltransferase involved in cell wall biosynthesis [Aeromonas sp. BIGb0405]